MSKQYHLKTGEAGEKQLDLLDWAFGVESRNFLLDSGLKPGMTVLDVG